MDNEVKGLLWWILGRLTLMIAFFVGVILRYFVEDWGFFEWVSMIYLTGLAVWETAIGTVFYLRRKKK